MILIISISIVVIFILNSLIKKQEYKKWNNGFCPKCKGVWEHLYTDSQGSKTYKCNNEHRCCL